MTDTEPSFGRTWLYRFSRPGEVEIETREFNGNDTAETYARELSKAQQTPIIIQWHDKVDWEYVTEVDANGPDQEDARGSNEPAPRNRHAR